MQPDDPIFRALVASRSSALSSGPLAEIGRVVANFAILEVHLSLLVHSLLSLPYPIGRVVTAEQSFKAMLTLAANLVRSRLNSEAQAEFRSVLKLIRGAEGQRNTIVHSLWGGVEEDCVIRTKYTAKERKGLTLQRDSLTTDDLHEIASDIAVACLELERFTNRHGFDTFVPYGADPEPERADP